MRIIAPNEYYHICNRGVGKQTIFHDTKDYFRFLFLILYFQSPQVFQNLARYINDFVQHPMLNIAEEVIGKRNVELAAFCIMPNHFHLLVKEVNDGGISSYIQRISNAYGKYYNTKYKRSGHVFQGVYKLIHINDDAQLLHTSAYIHRNPLEISKFKNTYEQYPWSSLQDIVNENRWGELIRFDILLGEFKNSSGYRKFVQTSPTKEYKKLFNI